MLVLQPADIEALRRLKAFAEAPERWLDAQAIVEGRAPRPGDPGLEGHRVAIAAEDGSLAATVIYAVTTQPGGRRARDFQVKLHRAAQGRVAHPVLVFWLADVAGLEVGTPEVLVDPEGVVHLIEVLPAGAMS